MTGLFQAWVVASITQNGVLQVNLRKYPRNMEIRKANQLTNNDDIIPDLLVSELVDQSCLAIQAVVLPDAS